MTRTLEEVIHASPDILIGKNGITEGLLEHIQTRLNREKILKLKVLERVSKQEVMELANEITESISAEILQPRGRTFILKKIKE